jgi:hypothetical protein
MWRWGRWKSTMRGELERGATRAIESMLAGLARVKSSVVRDWHTRKFVPAGGAVLCVTLAVVALYYANNPHVSTFSDTSEYLSVTQRLLAGGALVDVRRGPGYPLMIGVIWLLAGKENLTAVSIAQGLLFALAALETYALAFQVLRRVWMAVCIGLLVGANIFVLSFVKPILSDGFALWLTVTLALQVAQFLRTLRLRDFWLMVAALMVLVFTRWEWMYLALPLFAYLVVMAAQRGKGRRILVHGAAAAVLLYGLVGAYVAGNMAINGYLGVSTTQDVNLLGKVMQYRMQREAPARYSPQTAEINQFLAGGGFGPYALFLAYPEFSRNNYALAGSYARATIWAYPLQFLVKTMRLIPSTLNEPPVPMGEVAGQGPFASVLQALQRGSLVVYDSLAYFLFAAALWVALLALPWTRRSLLVQMMGALVLIALYDLASTAAGGYESYRRLHLGSDPLMILVVWGSLFLGARAVLTALRARAAYGRFGHVSKTINASAHRLE